MPQISHLVRARCSAGISRLAFAVWLLASVLTTARALAIGAGVFIVLGGVQIVATTLILLCAIRYQGASARCMRLAGPRPRQPGGRATRATSLVLGLRPAARLLARPRQPATAGHCGRPGLSRIRVPIRLLLEHPVGAECAPRRAQLALRDIARRLRLACRARITQGGPHLPSASMRSTSVRTSAGPAALKPASRKAGGGPMC